MINKSINKVVTDTIYLYSCGARGIAPENRDFDYNAIWELCGRLKISSTVAYAIKSGGACENNQDVYSRAQGIYFSSAVKNQKRIEATLDAIKAFENAEIEVTVLKGFDFARNYSNPYCRSSADSDLLIDGKDEEKAKEILQQCGFIIDRYNETTCHSVCRSDKAGIIELHTDLWNEIYDEIAFGKMNRVISDSQKKRVEFSDEKITVLDETYSLLFGIFHCVKHFTLSCCGLKMLFDIALFACEQEKNIDKNKIAEVVNMLGFGSFTGAVFKLTEKYAGLDLSGYRSYFECTQEQIDFLIEHIATSDMDEEIKAKGQYGFYVNKKYEKSGIKSRNLRKVKIAKDLVFMNPDVLAERYGYLKKYKFLYPVAVIQRIINRKNRDIKKAMDDNLSVFDEENATETDNNRIKCLKEFGLI